MDGNSSRDFLNSLPSLELELKKKGEGILIEGLKVVEVGRAFKKVKETCLGMNLQPGWEEAIKAFSRVYRQSDMTVTPKVFYILTI